MDTKEMEKLADAFKQMLRQHPELCPHDYGWISTNYDNGLSEYRCRLCGHVVKLIHYDKKE